MEDSLGVPGSSGSRVTQAPSDFRRILKRLEKDAQLGSPQKTHFFLVLERLQMQGTGAPDEDINAIFKEGVQKLIVISHQNPSEKEEKELESETGKGKEKEKELEGEAEGLEVGVGDACAVLGLLYEEGLGVPQDRPMAFQYYQKSASLGHPGGLCAVGWYYDKGRVVEKDPLMAFQFYQLAAERGNAAAKRNMALYLLEGTHGVRDEPRAFEILEELRRTDGEKMSSVLFTLASMYDKGQGVPINGRTAVRYYNQAMQRGHTGAMCNLGYKYSKGEGGVQQDPKKAAEMYQMAADQGSPAACLNMAVIHRYGRGVDKNLWAACDFYHRAMLRGHPRAPFSLADMHAMGCGVAEDQARALQYTRAGTAPRWFDG